MSKKTTFLVAVFLFLTILGWQLLLRGQRSVQNMPKDPDPSLGQPILSTEKPQETQAADSDVNFAKYNKTLSEQKITGVQDLEGPYKKVTVSDGEVTFSFEVPDHWLTELRNSGEVQMNEEELREFLGTKWDGDIRSGKVCGDTKVFDREIGDFVTKESCSYPVGDYWDFTWGMLKDMSYSEMKSYYAKMRDELSPGFPNATVTSDNKIWYTDIGWDQVNFYILDRTADSQYIKSVTSFCDTTECLKERYTKYTLDVEKKAERDEHGDVVVDKGHMHGFSQMMNLTDNKVLRIWKEAYVPGEFEEGTKHLIDTLMLE